MKLTEQLYKNLYRPYYHGTPYNTLDYSKSRYNAIYLTNSFVYAAMYSYKGDNEHGCVFEYRLQEGINIFNAYSKEDIKKLKLEIYKALKDKTSKFYNIFQGYVFDDNFYTKLCKYDWSYLLGGDKNRDYFIEIIKKAGFEGYFNFEWHKKSREDNKINFGFELENAPSIGVFDISKMKVIKRITYNDFFKFSDFLKAYDKDVENLSQYVSNLYNNGIENYKNLSYLYASENLLFLDFDTVKDIVSDPESLDENYQNTKNAKLFKECIQFGKSKNTYNGFTGYLNKNYIFRWKR